MKQITLLASDRGTWQPEPSPYFDEFSVRVVRWSGCPTDVSSLLEHRRSAFVGSDVLIPMYEHDVLAAALVGERLGIRALAFDAARRSVDRLALRHTLDNAINPPYGRGPQWKYPGTGLQVCKARASCGGSGVVVFEEIEDSERAVERAVLGAHEEIDRLRSAYSAHGDLFPEPEVLALFEGHVDGPQHEVSGAVAESGDMEIWAPLKQRWVGGKILGYEKSEGWDERLRDVAARAVANLGLSWCGFCVEVRQGNKVIEVNARLGDDGLGYDALLRGDHQTRYHRLLAFLRSRL